MVMSLPSVLQPTTALLVGLALSAPLATAAPHMQDADEDLPGYYRWYKKAGTDPRLKEETQRDAAMESGSDWAPRAIDRMAPDWSFPDAEGARVPLRVGGEGRNTLVVTFQSWW